ncbi:MAG: putative transcriptional [Planctomycetota bacterium]|nr:MAG: putative transcriptional [Planctomycetota bacterium]
MILDVFTSFELMQMRSVFEDIGTEEPADVWEGLLVQMRDLTGASAIQAFDVEGKPAHVLRILCLPCHDDLRLKVERVLRTGQPALAGTVLVFPVKWRLCVQGAVALEVPEGAVRPEIAWRLDTLLFYAGMFLAAAKGTELEALIRRAFLVRAGDSPESAASSLPGLIADGAAMQPVVRMGVRYAQADGVVLITGEPGSGKDSLVAGMHAVGPRRHQPLHEFSAPVGSEAQFEAELFGCEKGIAPGVSARPGHVRAAGPGILFLNEIGDIPHPTQAKVLRLIEKGEFSSVGSNRVEKSPARIMAATNRDLPAMVRAGTFRPDLFDRLDVLSLRIPPLRDHREDIPRLVRHFGSGRPKQVVTPGALGVWMEHDWPGNIRELKSRTERLALLGEGVVTAEAARDDLKASGHAAGGEGPKNQADLVREARKKSAMQSLVECGGDKKRASDQLGIGVRALEKQIKEFNLYSLLQE